ncbi:hypothetical protein EOD42_03075 [Rhodovarius crocodyli]|uniref:Tip attachment protein J domain-containing protein n=1 Tax=Rhodovarius crocodyli TaxID=1979269 RepID=A0A437MN77_9PROT|nr:hypothetical protein [Rhodovarius crocodyli]RVT99104.1 hypothetical protein EOD42_03075 [Rhodovarius crocodyli]
MTVLGAYPVGIEEPTPPVALDLLALPQPALSDAVLLVECTATDGILTTLGGALTLGAEPVGILPGGLTGGQVPLQWSDVDWTSQPGDLRPSTHFEGRLSDISLERALPLDPSAERRVAAALGEIIIDNTDGAYDGTAEGLAIDGRPVTLSLLGSRGAAYADRRVLFAGVGRAWRTDRRQLRINVASLAYVLDVPMLGLYGGTGGADGGEDLAGKVVPEAWGRVRNVPPPQLDAGLLIYQLHAREIGEITGVYVRGAPLDAGAGYGTYSALAAATVLPGTYAWAITPTGSYMRLGSSPDGTVTADLWGQPGGASIPRMMRLVLARGGVLANPATFDSAEGYVPGTAGIWLAEQLTFADAINRLAAGGGLWWGDDGSGSVVVGRVSAPAGPGGVALDQDSILDDLEPLEPPVPAWRVVLTYRRNWSPLSGTDLVPEPTITEARRLELAATGRSTAVQIDARRVRNAQARDIALETLFDDEGDAAVLGNNILTLLAPGRTLWRVPGGLSGWGLALGQQARLTWPRYGLAAGRDVRVVGQSARGNRLDLTVLG